MLTIFTIPKPFRGHLGLIQRNAIESWTLLRPGCEIILFGSDDGTAETAERLGMLHLPGVARNEYGTPLVNDIFAQAERVARNDLLCYVNADIILTSEFTRALARVARYKGRFLMVGQRWDLDLYEPLDFGPNWEERLRARLTRDGRPASIAALDYFAFPRGLWGEIPPFAVGRTAWDNWLLFRARERGARVVDATRAVFVVHQNHDYSHAPGGTFGAWLGPEAQRNRALLGGDDHNLTLRDVTWLLTGWGLLPALTPWYLLRRLSLWLDRHPRLRPLLNGARRIRSRARRSVTADAGRSSRI